MTIGYASSINKRRAISQVFNPTYVAPPVDAYAKYNTLLLNGDGVNGAQNNTFIDSSSNNISLTRNGNLTQGSFNPYGTLWSNYIPSGSYFTAPDNSAFDFGAGDFTIEGWANFTSTSGTQNIVCRNYSASTGFILSNVNFLANITTDWDVNITFSSGFTANTWQHFAVVRSGNAFTCYINGASVGTQTISGTIQSSSGDLQIGRRNGQSGFAGYLSNLRIVKGTAVYTAPFTPPTTPLTNISGTSLLTCQANRFIDSSTNNFTITVNDSPQVQPFSPFNPTTAYNSTTLGASGYFNSSSYLSFNSSAAQVGSNDFTFESWFYPTDEGPYGGGGSICCIGGDNNGYFGFNFGVYPQYGISYGMSSGSGWYSPGTSVTSLKPFQWYHVAVTRSSGNIVVYLNGQSVGTGSFSNSKTGSENYIGYYTNHSSNYDSTYGYMAGWRLVIGSVVYSGNFTPPTTPPANITNTALLPKYDNAGIYDLAMQNDLQTVGSTQVSTSVKKYGTGSISFNGSTDWLSIASNQSAQFNAGNFTIECWMYPTSLSGANVFHCYGYQTTSTRSTLAYLNGGNIRFAYSPDGSTSTDSNLGAHGMSINNWYYVAIVRNGTTVTAYVNGTALSSPINISTTSVYNSAQPLVIGSDTSGDNFAGYIDDYRITKGYARYTSNFTPPSAALTIP